MKYIIGIAFAIVFLVLVKLLHYHNIFLMSNFSMGFFSCVAYNTGKSLYSEKEK